MKYKGLYGLNIKAENLVNGESTKVIYTSIRVSKDMKIANGKTGEKLLNDLYNNNSNYRDNVNLSFHSGAFRTIHFQVEQVQCGEKQKKT